MFGLDWTGFNGAHFAVFYAWAFYVTRPLWKEK